MLKESFCIAAEGTAGYFCITM